MTRKRLVASMLSMLFAGAVSAFGQAPDPQPTVKAARLMPVSESNLYCGGFITKGGVPHTSFVEGGWSSPNAARFAAGEYIYIAGPALKPGEVYSIVRESGNPSKQELYSGQHRGLSGLGDLYGEIGRAKIVGEANGSSIAQIVFSCEEALAGDYLIPFQQRDKITVPEQIDFDRFAPTGKNISGRIVMARDFDAYLGNGQTAYLNIGSDKGVKVGDYFRVVRAYTPDALDAADRVSYKATLADDAQKHRVRTDAEHSYVPGKASKVKLHNFPVRSLGELIVTNVTPTSATAMVTFSLQELQVGDMVERDNVSTAADKAQPKD
jgi:hypothetical protein